MKKILTLMTLLICTFLGGTVFAETLEQGKRLFNQKEYQQAHDVLSQLSDQGDANATFWLGVTQYKMGQRFEAGKTILKAAEMGDPWAMGVLGGGELYATPPCHYMGWSCDDKWEDKAIATWEKQSQLGDGKATFARNMSKTDWWEFIPFYQGRKYQELAENGVQQGGYSYLEYGIYWKSKEKKMEALQVAADRGYAPAMVDLYYAIGKIDKDTANRWINQAIELGYAPAATTLYLVYSQGYNGVKHDFKKAYYYNKLSGLLGGDETESHHITQRLVLDEDGKIVRGADDQIMFEILITEEEQAELDKQVEEFAKDIKPNMFLDEISIDLF